MLDLPVSLTMSFVAITLLAYVLFINTMWHSEQERVKKRMHAVALFTLAWLIFQSTLSLNGWYMDRKAVPPHLMFPIASAIVGILILFNTPRGKRFIDGLSERALFWVHFIRVPVEFALYSLAVEKQVPWSMTFYGHNYDIIMGLSVPLIFFAAYYKNWLGKKALITWNVIGIVSLLIIVITAIGAAPSPFQLWDIDRPNYAVLHFPFSWLPSFIVPLVLFSHLVLLRRLLTKR